MWLFLSILLIIEAMMGFVVFTVDTAVTEQAPLQSRVIVAALWPKTMVSWFSNQAQESDRLNRLKSNIWLLVPFGWLIGFEYDHMQGSQWLPLVAWATPAFVVYCVDGMSVKFYKKPLRRLMRALAWPKAFGEYLCDPDSIRIVRATFLVWIMLTSCWLVGIGLDRFGPR